MTELILTLVMVTLVSIIYVLIDYFDWLSLKNKTSPQVTFSTFKKLYMISPSKWRLYWSCISYNATVDGIDNWMPIEFKHFNDFIMYKMFYYKVTENEEFFEQIENKKCFIASIQKDIDLYNENNILKIN